MVLSLRKLMFLLLICKSFGMSSKMFTSYLKDKLLPEYYRQSVVASRMGCMYSCVVDHLCFGVAYHKSRQMCYYYSQFPKCYTTNVVDVGLEIILPADSFMNNIALNKPANMSSAFGSGKPCRGVDGSLVGVSVTNPSAVEWWCVDLERLYNFQSIVLHSNRNPGFELRLGNTGQCTSEAHDVSTICYKDYETTSLDTYNIASCNQASVSFSSRSIFISLRTGLALSFGELEVSGQIA